MADQRDLLSTWLKRVRENQHAHYRAEVQFDKLHFRIGVPAAAFSVIIGTSVFASLNSVVDIRLKILVGLASITAATLSGLQTFLRYSDRAERHRRAGRQFASIRRSMEHHLCLGNGHITPDLVSKIRKRYDAIASEAPYIPRNIWKDVENIDQHYFLSEEGAERMARTAADQRDSTTDITRIADDRANA